MPTAEDLVQRYGEPEADPDYQDQMAGVGQLAGAAATGIPAQALRGWGMIAGTPGAENIHGTQIGEAGQRLLHTAEPGFKPATDAAKWLGNKYSEGVNQDADLISKYLGTGAGAEVAALGAVAPNFLGPAGEEKTLAEAALHGLPDKVDIPGHGTVDVGPNHQIRQVADKYMKEAGIQNAPQKNYVMINPAEAKRVADAYEAMPHAPDDPKVKASYDALIKETNAQYQHIKAAGLTPEFIPHGASDPYAASPRLATEDINKNNHFWVFPTSSGFGIEGAAIADHPMLGLSGETISGQPATNNDIFRVVHDYFGHAKEGLGFRAAGEENAWRQHAQMYSDLARPAMTAETRGQNSWVNHGPHAEANKGASGADTVYAPQKAGVLPDEFNTLGDHFNHAEKLVKDNGGVTLNPTTGQVNPPEGYAVSTYKGNEHILPHAPSAGEMRQYVDKQQDLFKNDPGAHLGVWEDPPQSGQHYLDVSHVEPDLDKAQQLARDHKQLGIFDLAKGETIPTDWGTPASRLKADFDHMNPEEAPAGYLGKRVNGNATADMYLDPGDENTVHLEKLEADTPGQGHGTAALQHITNLADQHGARITLDAVPQGDNPVSKERLMAYYQQHGFKPDGRTESSMTREPAPAGNVAAESDPLAHQAEYAKFASGEPTVQPGDLAAKYQADIQGQVPEKYQTKGQQLDPAANMLNPAEYEAIAKSQPNIEGFNQIINILPKASEMAAVAKAGEAKRGWYRASSQAIQDVFGPEDAPRFAGLLAALSPQTDVASNLQNALKSWTNWEAAGRPTDHNSIRAVLGASVAGSGGEASVLPAWINNSVTALSHPDPKSMELSGFKVNSFMNNLLKDTQAVTNDAWMANYGLPPAEKLGKMGILTPKQVENEGPQKVWGRRSGYSAMTARTRQAADLAGINPENVQESTWSVAKALYELGHGGVSRDAYLEKLGETHPELAAKFREIPRSSLHVLESGALTPGVINSVPDFGTLMKDPKYGALLSDTYRHAIHDTPAPIWHDPVPLSTEEEKHLQNVARRLDVLGHVRAK